MLRPKKSVVPPLEASVFGQKENREGMSYRIFYDSHRMETAGVLPTARASLAQTTVLKRMQTSHRLSLTGFPARLAMLAGYPAVHALTLLKGSPDPNSVPASANPVQSIDWQPIQRGGTMKAPPRFKKALPLPINNYQPPVY